MGSSLNLAYILSPKSCYSFALLDLKADTRQLSCLVNLVRIYHVWFQCKPNITTSYKVYNTYHWFGGLGYTWTFHHKPTETTSEILMMPSPLTSATAR